MMNAIPATPASDAAFLARNGKPMPPAHTGNTAKAAHAAHEYEGIFIAQLLGAMFAGIPTDGPFGGGPGEAMFRSLLVDRYAQGMAAQGGLGLAAHMQAELLKHQGGAP